MENRFNNIQVERVVKASGTFTTKNSQILNVLDARLDIIVPQGYNITVFDNLVNYGRQIDKNVNINFIIK